MQCTVVEFQVKPESYDAWLVGFGAAQKTVYDEEPGCIMFQLLKRRKRNLAPEDPLRGNFVLLAVFESVEALKFHGEEVLPKLLNTPTMQNMLAAPSKGTSMPVCGVAMHRKDIDDHEDVMWVIGEIPVPTENAKELEKWMCAAMPKMEAEEPLTLFYNMLGPFKTENGVSYYYQIDA